MTSSVSRELKRAKRRVRREALARRDAIPQDDRERAGLAVADRVLALFHERRPGRTVLAFWAFGSEVPTEGLIGKLVAAGYRIALPRIVAGELELHEYRPGDPVTETSFGACEPVGGLLVRPEEVDVVLTPSVAFDRSGFRVGYGGGFYDRLFARLKDPGALRVGIGLDVQVIEGELPRGEVDHPVDLVVTERRVLDCRAGGSE